MTALQICPFAVLNVVLFRCLFNVYRQTNNRTPFLGVLLIWQIGLGKIPKASPRENGDNYSLAFNTRLDFVDRWSMTLIWQNLVLKRSERVEGGKRDNRVRGLKVRARYPGCSRRWNRTCVDWQIQWQQRKRWVGWAPGTVDSCRKLNWGFRCLWMCLLWNSPVFKQEEIRLWVWVAQLCW